MGADGHSKKITRPIKLLICRLIFAVSATFFIVPDILARGGETGAQAGFGTYRGGHGSGDFSGYSHIGSDHGYFAGDYYGDPRDFDFGYIYFPGYYVPSPYAYSYSYPSYSYHKPQYEAFVPYAGEYKHPQKDNRQGRVYRYNSASVRYPAIGNGDSYSTNDLGWRLLEQNSAREALDVFAIQVGQHPKDGIPKVGYALSAAMQRDLNKAAWAMRSAFSIDPDSLQYLRIDASLRTGIDMLLDEYHNQLNYAQGNRHFDVVFMIAALNYLIQEIDAARAAIEESVSKLGDSSPSAVNLQRLVTDNKS